MKGFKKICLFALSALMLAGCVTGCTKLPEQTAEPQKNTEPVPFLQPASDSDSKAKSEAPKEPVASTEPGLIYSTTVDDLQTGFCVLTMDDEFHITPGEGFTDEVTWISSDEDVAAVNNGVVLPVGQGKADIFFTDGQAAATQHVVVNTSPETASPAGKLLIELKGRLYECGISKAQWDQTGKRPEYFISDFEAVYKADGVYYARAEFLFNVLCCFFGDHTAANSPDGGLPQLTGSAEIKNVETGPSVNWLTENSALATRSIMFELPDKSTAGFNYCTQYFKYSRQADEFYFHTITAEKGFYHDVEYYLSLFGVEFTLRYDEELQALVVSL